MNKLSLEKITDFCRHWQVNEICLFGFVLSDNFGSKSDVDVMVQFDPAACPTFLRIEVSRNYLRRNQILSSAKVVYVA
jgi:predicted nucleotidyltransferase